MDKNKQERLVVINTIIKEISTRGRKFFHSAKTDKTAELIVKRGKVYYQCEYTDKLLCLSVPDTRKPDGWKHGGTMMGLVRDFTDYIQQGGDTNHNHGYGGLFSPHWGYPEEDMIAIREKAHDLGYLKSPKMYRKDEDNEV